MSEKSAAAENGNGAAAKAAPSKERELSLSYARTLSWLSLLVVLAVSLGLSVLISNKTYQTLMERQEGLAMMLAHNLNNQIFQRFAVPTIREHGAIALRQEQQQQLMDSVVRSVIVGLPVYKLRVFDVRSRGVTYSTDSAEFGRMDMAPGDIDEALEGRTPKPIIISSLPFWKIPVSWPLEPGAVQLRVLFPLRGDPYLIKLAIREWIIREYLNEELDYLPEQISIEKTPIMGVLELTQDITEDYVQVVVLQVVIVLMCLMSSAIMFVLLLIMIKRAENVLNLRMQKNLQLEKELQSTERLVSMGRVVASIAHEIRNPLGIIRSTAELLQKRAGASSDRGTQRLLAAMHDETLRLSQTVNDFLDYARPRQPKQDPVELELVVNQIMAFVEGDFERSGVHVTRRFEARLWVLGDKDLLYRALYNVMVNGRQAMKGEGTLDVYAFPADGMAVIIVTDSGPGFDEGLIDKLFEPFFTTKDAGTGLGLPIVRSIIESHGGSVRLYNVESGGARVEVRLPLAPSDAVPENAARTEETA